MNMPEQVPRFEEMPDFGMEAFGINAAFQEATMGVMSDPELALDEKVRRMEVIVSEGTSEVYRDFVDFRQMAAQMEMMCSHDHALNQSMRGNDTLSSFMDDHKADDGYDHSDSPGKRGAHKDEDEYETDPITGKKTNKKKYYGWFGVAKLS